MGILVVFKRLLGKLKHGRGFLNLVLGTSVWCRALQIDEADQEQYELQEKGRREEK